MKRLITILFLTITTICFGQKTTPFADSIRKAYKIPALNYAVVTDKSIMEIQALGLHSIALNDLSTLNDRFHIGFNTKAMTAFVIAKYVEKGKLKWKTKFFDIFPEWKETSKVDYYNITLQDLLSHRAKIQAFQGDNDPAIPDFKGTKQEKRSQFGKFVLTLNPVEIESNHQFSYSNAGYTLATLMLENVSQQSWEQMVEKVFNKDLKLNVKFSWPENKKIKDTWGHSFENDKLTPVPSNTDYHLDFTEPAGDINIRVKDYAKFILLNLKGLNGHNNYLTAKTYQFVHKGI